MAAELKPVLGFYNPNDGTPVPGNIIDFGYVSPGGYTKEIELDLWNNKHPNLEVFVRRRDKWGNIIEIDESTPEAKALNASFPDAYSVFLVPSARDDNGNYARIERFNPKAVPPKATDPAPCSDWYIEYMKYNDITQQWDSWTMLDPDVEFVGQLMGHRTDPQLLTNPAEAEAADRDKHVIFKMRMFVPANAAMEDFRFYLRPTYKTYPLTSGPGPGATNYL